MSEFPTARTIRRDINAWLADNPRGAWKPKFRAHDVDWVAVSIALGLITTINKLRWKDSLIRFALWEARDHLREAQRLMAIEGDERRMSP